MKLFFSEKQIDYLEKCFKANYLLEKWFYHDTAMVVYANVEDSNNNIYFYIDKELYFINLESLYYIEDDFNKMDIKARAELMELLNKGSC